MALKHGKSLLRNVTPPKPVKLHLLVTRASGDTERYELGEVADLRFAVEYRRKLHKVALPRRLPTGWRMPVDTATASRRRAA